MLSIEKLVETILNGNISDGKTYFQNYDMRMKHNFFEYVNSEMLTDEKKNVIFIGLLELDHHKNYVNYIKNYIENKICQLCMNLRMKMLPK